MKFQILYFKLTNLIFQKWINIHLEVHNPTMVLRFSKKHYGQIFLLDVLHLCYHGHLFVFGWALPILTQNLETMALRTLTTVDLFYFIMGEDPHE